MCVALLLAVGMVFAATAAAEPVSLEGSEIWVQLWPEGEPGTNVLIVGVDLPADTVFPATVRLPIPDGATVFWAGEIMGADPNTDLTREFEVVDTGNGQAVEFSAESTTNVQIDATFGSIVVDGNDLISTLDWRQSVPSASTTFAVRLPAGTGDVDITPKPPGEPQENGAGEKLYTLTGAILAPGDTYRIEAVYRRAGVQDLDSSPVPPLVWVLGGLLAVAVVALVAAIATQKRRAAI